MCALCTVSCLYYLPYRIQSFTTLLQSSYYGKTKVYVILKVKSEQINRNYYNLLSIAFLYDAVDHCTKVEIESGGSKLYPVVRTKGCNWIIPANLRCTVFSSLNCYPGSDLTYIHNLVTRSPTQWNCYNLHSTDVDKLTSKCKTL